MRCALCLLRSLARGQRPLLAAARHPGVASLRSAPPLLPPSSPLLPSWQLQAWRNFHCSPASSQKPPLPADLSNEQNKKSDASVATQDNLFELVAAESRTKATFIKVLDVFVKRDVRRRGHVDFIYAALKKMPEFGVQKDLAVYNKLLDVFPKEVFVPRNFIQRMFNHYPRQQECGVQLLEQMECYGILPNVETKVLLVQIFGEKSHPMRKYQRLMYWFPKFKHLNPFPIPLELPQDPVDLARFSLTRIANDLDAQVTVYQLPCTDVSESGETTTLPHVVGIQSPSQVELLAQHNPSRPVVVEGPFPLWLRKTCLHYYVLRADAVPSDEKVEEPYDPERCLDYPLQLDLDLARDLGDDESFDVEDLDEGPVFAMCMTGSGDQATLNQWISGLQQNNPILGRVPTLFRLEARPKELQQMTDSESAQQRRSEPQRKTEEEEEEEVEEPLQEQPQRKQRMNS